MKYPFKFTCDKWVITIDLAEVISIARREDDLDGYVTISAKDDGGDNQGWRIIGKEWMAFKLAWAQYLEIFTKGQVDKDVLIENLSKQRDDAVGLLVKALKSLDDYQKMYESLDSVNKQTALIADQLLNNFKDVLEKVNSNIL